MGKETLSVVIADDEKGVVELIKHLIHSENVHVEIVGEAYNGLSAYELITEHKPDVAITDIRMPGLTGIELIQKCSETCPETTFVMISGFQEFAYAQAALQHGAADYLLKPLNKAALNETLARILREKGKKATREARVLEDSRILSANTDILRKQSLLALAMGHKVSEEPSLAAFLKESVFNQEPGRYCIGIVKLSDTIRASSSVSRDTVDILMGKICRCLAEDCMDIEFCSQTSTGVLYLHYRHDQQSIGQKCERLRREIQDDSYRYELLDITIGFGTEVLTPGDLPVSYETALAAVRSRIDTGSGTVLQYDERVHVQPRFVLSPSDSLQLKRLLEQMDEKEICSMIHSLFDTWRAAHRPSAGLYVLANELLQLVYRELTINLPDCQVPDCRESCMLIENCMSSASLEDACMQYASLAVKACCEQKETATSKPVREICRYLQEHYKEPISLKEIARLVALSPVYVSSIFKKEKGMSISAYFTELRLEKAKELLRTTPMTVSAIAEAVGYQNTRYFSKLFIKSVGIKPMDYRKFYS